METEFLLGRFFLNKLNIVFFVLMFSNTFNSHSLLATDNSDPPAGSDHLDSRYKFSLFKRNQAIYTCETWHKSSNLLKMIVFIFY